MLYRPSAYPGLRLRSLARLYPAGINLLTIGRPDLLYIRIQNRGSNSVYFWHGRVPEGAAGTGSDLPLNPADWTTTQLDNAKLLIEEYGEKIDSNEKWEPSVAHTGIVYSFVKASTNKSQVIIGLQQDQEQGVGSYQEREDSGP